MEIPTPNGIVAIPSHFSVDETVDRIKAALTARNIKLFAVIDHSGEAKAAGLEMQPTKLVIFGNPAAGTPLMLAAPSAALDLPLKLLVSQDKEGRTWVSYNSPDFLQTRHQFPVDLKRNIAAVEALAAHAAGAAPSSQ
jgi:uncharacterized protein (DUF302 family)